MPNKVRKTPDIKESTSDRKITRNWIVRIPKGKVLLVEYLDQEGRESVKRK